MQLIQSSVIKTAMANLQGNESSFTTRLTIAKVLVENLLGEVFAQIKAARASFNDPAIFTDCVSDFAAIGGFGT